MRQLNGPTRPIVPADERRELLLALESVDQVMVFDMEAGRERMLTPVVEQLSRQGDRDAARTSYAAVIPTDNWYAALAAARLGQRFTPTLTPLARDEGELARTAANPGMVRTRELILCDMQSEANAEWRAALDALTPAQQMQEVRLASGWGWHMQAIAAAAKLGQFNDYELLYPPRTTPRYAVARNSPECHGR